MAHKGKGRPEADGAQHEEEAVAHTRHVPEEERRLHEPAHVGPRVVVVEAVPEDEEPGRTSAEDAPAKKQPRAFSMSVREALARLMTRQTRQCLPEIPTPESASRGRLSRKTFKLFLGFWTS